MYDERRPSTDLTCLAQMPTYVWIVGPSSKEESSQSMVSANARTMKKTTDFMSTEKPTQDSRDSSQLEMHEENALQKRMNSETAPKHTMQSRSFMLNLVDRASRTQIMDTGQKVGGVLVRG